MKTILVKIIRAYQILLSPFLGNRCRFLPTCSHYGVEAITEHGALKGSFLTTKRILKCHPFHPGGLDPVPKPPSANAAENRINEISDQEKIING